MTATSATPKTLLDVSRRAYRLGHSMHCDVAKGLHGELMECSLLVAPGLINGFVSAQQGTADWTFVTQQQARGILVIRA